MLAWKWWRDCRGRVILYCGAALVMGVFAAVDGTAFNSWLERFKDDPARYQFYVFLTWNRVGYGLSSPATWGAVWMGLALAITSFGRDYASPAASFMVTRPRRRIAMLWTDWALTQATVVIAAALLVGSAVLITSRVLPNLGASELWVMFPPAIALAVTVYGLALFWTAATRSAVRGVELSIATMLVFTLAPGALLEWWHIAWPDRVQNWMLELFGWRSQAWYWIDNPLRASNLRAAYYVRPVMYHSVEPYPIGALMVWIGLGLAFTYATQKIMERREI